MMFVSEERRVAERIKDFIKDEDPPKYVYIMLRNGRILDVDDYRPMVESGKINPKDAYVFIGINRLSSSDFRYPFLVWYRAILFAYLSKLGFYHGVSVVPATGLKYVAFAEEYRDYLSIEVSDLDTVVNNTNLRNIVVEVLGGKLISGEKLTDEEYEKIRGVFKSQRLFAGYDFDEAWGRIIEYYDEGKQSLAKEVARIAMDYDRIFNPYRVCYKTKTWDEVDCWSIKL